MKNINLIKISTSTWYEYKKTHRQLQVLVLPVVQTQLFPSVTNIYFGDFWRAAGFVAMH